MWTQDAAGQEAGYPPWVSDPPSSEYDANSAPPFLVSPPMPPVVGVTFPDASHANQLASMMKTQIENLSGRVQKLERSRGQISKDLSGMINETREMLKLVGVVEPLQEVKSTSSLAELGEAPNGGANVDVCTGTSQTEAEQADSASVKSVVVEPPAAPPGLGMPVPESLSVAQVDVDGKQVPRVQWRIDNMKAKFKDCVGRPLVSPSFEAAGLPDCRLMISPNFGVDVSGLSMREQKSKYEARLSEGPLSGTLKFKVVTSAGDQLVIKFSLFVGNISKGPLQHDFAEHVIHGVEFPHNWFDELQGSALVVGVDVLDVQRVLH